MAETMSICWHRQFGTPTRIVRPFHTYGPGMNLDDGRVFADFVADIIQTRDISVLSDGMAVRSFCYLADAVEGFFTVMLKGHDGRAYNIGNDKAEMSIMDLATCVAGLFPEKNISVIQKPISSDSSSSRTEVSRVCPDISEMRALGWEPTTSIEDGFRRTIRSFM